jgi:hypothetical protein
MCAAGQPRSPWGNEPRRFGAGFFATLKDWEFMIQKFRSSEERRLDMDQTTIIRIVAGALFVIVLGILVQRRRTQVK